MATDVEESDTDDHERPVPPKRHCARLVSTGESYKPEEISGESNERRKVQDNDEEEEEEEEEGEQDEMERLSAEKLRLWQECQVAKGFLDNTINRIVEDYILNPPMVNHSSANVSADGIAQFRPFRGDDMEDTAVTMAIRNRGLVHTEPNVDLVSDICWSTDENSGQSCTRSIENQPSSSAVSESTPSTRDVAHQDRCRRNDRLRDNEATSSWNDDEMDESDREQDFLERAVAEAIKKKGLSALSVDYG